MIANSFSRLSKFFLAAALFSVIIVSHSSFFPYIVPKAVFFRVAVELALIFFYFDFILAPHRYREILSKRIWSPIFIAVTLFVVAFLLAGFLGSNPHLSFWSNFERGEGGWQMIHYYFFFGLLSVCLTTDADWENFFKVSILAGLLVLGYGWAASQNLPGFISPNNPTRLEGSLGNPAYLAGYLIFLIFYLGYLWLNKKTTWRGKIVLGFLFGLFLISLFLTQTRGAFFGLIIAVIAGLIFLVFSGERKTKVVAGTLLLLLVFLGALIMISRFEGLSSAPIFGHLFNFSLEDRSLQARLWAYQSAWQGFKEKPVLGWGPENFSLVFEKYFDARHFIPETGSETWFDRAHNIIFDYLTAAGLVGLLSYLGIFLVFYQQFWRWRQSHRAESISKAEGFRDPAIKQSVLLALPLAYLGQGMFVFDTLPVYLNLFFFLAFAIHLFGKKRKRQ